MALNKDGSFMTGFRFRGPDLESSTEEELMAVRARPFPLRPCIKDAARDCVVRARSIGFDGTKFSSDAPDAYRCGVNREWRF